MEKGLETFPIQRIINEPYVCIQSNRLFTTLQRPSILKYILSVMVIISFLKRRAPLRFGIPWLLSGYYFLNG